MLVLSKAEFPKTIYFNDIEREKLPVCDDLLHVFVAIVILRL
jgi:hypothetical protein